MEKLLVVVSQGATREFESSKNGAKESVKAVDLILVDGINTFAASAFGAVAQRLTDHPLNNGAMITAELVFSVRNVKTERGSEFAQQNVTLSNYGILG